MILLLDVDGVVNAVTNRAFPASWPPDTWHHEPLLNKTEKRSYPMKWSSDVIDLLTELASKVDIRWHTTWQEDALDVGELMGLPVFPVEITPVRGKETFSGDHFHDWWKTHRVRYLLDSGQTIIWVDDDINYYMYRPSYMWFLQGCAAGKILPVCPDSLLGLAPEDFQKINDFIVK